MRTLGRKGLKAGIGASALLLLLNGRIAGISGIAGRLLVAQDRGWRLAFVAGLVAMSLNRRFQRLIP